MGWGGVLGRGPQGGGDGGDGGGHGDGGSLGGDGNGGGCVGFSAKMDLKTVITTGASQRAPRQGDSIVKRLFDVNDA